jgi:uncharacterized protein YbjT (DUF2867 family)
MWVIAGVSGHVGSIAAEKLLDRKKPVRVLVRDEKKGAPWKQRGGEVAQLSLEDTGALAKALQGAQGFFVLLPSNFAAPNVYEYQRKLSDAIGAAVTQSKVPHVVLLSSLGAEHEGGTGPIRGLHYLEETLRKTGTTLSTVRAGYFAENVGNSVGAAKATGMYFNFSGSLDQPRPMVATKDIGHLVAEILEKGAQKHEVIDIIGPAYSQRQVVDKLQAALEKKLQVVDVPPQDWTEALVKGGLPKPFAEAFAEMYGAFAKGLIAPKGDRLVQGKTTLDEVLRGLLSA